VKTKRDNGKTKTKKPLSNTESVKADVRWAVGGWERRIYGGKDF